MENIFGNYKGYLGDINLESVSESGKKLTQLPQRFRQKLGNKGYLMDQYLSKVFSALIINLAVDAANSGFYESGNLRVLCCGILYCEVNQELECHWFYEEVKDYIETHPLPYEELTTKAGVYSCHLMDCFIKGSVERYYLECKRKFPADFDLITVKELYKKLDALLDFDGSMETLNTLISERFYISNPMQIYLQGINNNFLFNLTDRDPESNKQIFGLILELD